MSDAVPLPPPSAGAEMVAAHYRLVAPLLAEAFGIIPVVGATYPNGYSEPCTYLAQPPLPWPTGTHAITFTSRSGPHSYAGLDAKCIAWLVTLGAVEFHSWMPTPNDPTRAAFCTMLLEPHGRADGRRLKEACRALRATLNRHGVDGALVLSGFKGARVVIPLAGGPAYPQVRLALHAIAADAARAHQKLLTVGPKAERGDRVYVQVSTNAPGRWSALPYSLRATDALDVATPITWDELDTLENGSVTAADFPQRLTGRGKSS